MPKSWAAACALLAGCGFAPEAGDWNVDGTIEEGRCATFPALPGQLDVVEADEGFQIALPDGSATAACTLERRAFDCAPLAFEWRHATETEESFLDEALTFRGTFQSREEMSGAARMELACKDEACPNDGECAMTFGFSAVYDAWFGLG